MTILVTGATGNVGRHVVAQLAEAGQSVRALTRAPEKAALPAEVEVVRGDLTDPHTLGDAFTGIDRMHLFASGDSAGVVKAAQHAGVRRIVVLSSIGVVDARPDSGPDYHHINELMAERAVRSADIEWAIVRSSELMTNTVEWREFIHADGVVRAPFGQVPRNPVHEADVAAVSVAALLEDGHHGSVYAVSGPETITAVEQVRLISEALGRDDVRFEELTPEQARELWVEQFYTPEHIADWLIATAYDYGEVWPTVPQVTGRPARTFAQWVTEHVADFR